MIICTCPPEFAGTDKRSFDCEACRPVEIEIHPCARCGTGVETKWTALGMVPDSNVTLVADWVFHSSCWDGLVRGNPP